MKEKIKLEEFFEFGKNEPMQRLAYNKEDVEYKLKVIKKMKELGMKVKIDRMGNICATLEGSGKSNKSILMCSHTDSVKDGGQYDGPAGVISALKVIEEVIDKKEKGELDLDCDLKVVVWACEESARFGKACLGSKWVEGTLNEEQLEMKETLKKAEQEKKTLGEAIEEYLNTIKASGIEDIEYVDKVISMEEILSAYELHIEQYQYLSENNIDIGVVSSITAPYRMAVKIGREKDKYKDKNKVVDAAKLVVELNKKAKEAEKIENRQRYRATIPIIDIEQEMIKEPDFFIDIELLGSQDHSGSTPMNRRKDPILAASRIILKLNERIKQEKYDFKVYFNKVSSRNDNINKVAGDANIRLGIDANGLPEDIISNVLSNIIEEVCIEEGVKSTCKKTHEKFTKEAKEDATDELKLDVRMQTSTNAEEIFEEISNMIIGIAEETKGSYKCKKTDKGVPAKTSTNLINQVHEVCRENGMTSETTKSWAGHDIAHMSILEKILIFIKSTGGSHNPNENTTKECIENGIVVLTGTVVKDIEKVHKAVEKMEYFEDNTLESLFNKGRERKQVAKQVLADVTDAKKYGIKVPKKVRADLIKAIMGNSRKDNVAEK